MKKFNKICAFLLTATLLVGCGKEKDKTVSALPSNGSTSVATSGKEKTGTFEKLYQTLYSDSKVMDHIFDEIAKQELLKGMEQTELDAIIAERRQETLEDFAEKDEYKDTSLTNGVISLFNEKLLVRELRLSGLNIPCANNEYGPEINADYTYKEGKVFKCDYTEYFEKKVDSAILQHLLIEKYIREVKPNTLDKNETVKVKYLAIPSADYEYLAEKDPLVSYVELEAGVTPAIGHYVKTGENTYVEITASNSTEYLGTGTYTYYTKVETPQYEKATARTKQFMIDAVKALVEGKTLEEIEETWEANKKEVEQFTYEKACPFDADKVNKNYDHANAENACSEYTNKGSYPDYVGYALKLHILRKLNMY